MKIKAVLGDIYYPKNYNDINYAKQPLIDL